ncbi:hypothetical protein KI387_026814, partial [Taxus chinensis]
MGIKKKYEPEDDSQLLVDEEVASIFEHAGCLEFLKKFLRHNDKLLREFVINLEQFRIK